MINDNDDDKNIQSDDIAETIQEESELEKLKKKLKNCARQTKNIWPDGKSQGRLRESGSAIRKKA